MSGPRRRHSRHQNAVSDLHEPLLSPDLGSHLGLDAAVLSDEESDAVPDHEHPWDEPPLVQRHWHSLIAGLLASWLSWLEPLPRTAWRSVTAVVGFLASALLFGRLAAGDEYSAPPVLSEQQAAHLEALLARVRVPFDSSLAPHQAALRRLWASAYPGRSLTGLKSPQWREMGWQGDDPSTDFRGGGFISLENLIFFSESHPEAFQRLLSKSEGKRAEWEYPFAVAGLNITFMLIELLDLKADGAVPRTQVGSRFLDLLEDDADAFDSLYCVAFQILDKQWLAMRASYMEFNDRKWTHIHEPDSDKCVHETEAETNYCACIWPLDYLVMTQG